MAAQQVREILTRLRAIHNGLSESYDDCRADAREERMRTALRCMSAHETQIVTWLRDHLAHADEGVLNSFIQFAPGFALDRLLDEHSLDPQQSTEEILDVAVGTDQKLVDLYRRLADSASAPRVREMFADLLQLVEIKGLQFTRTAVEMSDE